MDKMSKITCGIAGEYLVAAELSRRHGNQFSLAVKMDKIFSDSSKQSNISLEIGRLEAVLFL